MSESLVVHDVAALRNLGVVARKAVAMDASALLRVRPRTTDGFASTGVARVWATTPFGPVACRTMAVTPGRADMVVRADAVVAATGDGDAVPAADSAVPVSLSCGAGADASWPGSLPLDDDWKLVNIVPARVLRDLEKSARAVAKAESGPLGLPTSLLDQKVLTVRADGAGDAGAGDSGGVAEAGGTIGAGEAGAGAGDSSRADGVGEATGADESEVPSSVPAAHITMREVFALCAMGFIPAEPGPDEPVRVSRRGRWRRMDGRFGSVYANEGLGVLPI